MIEPDTIKLLRECDAGVTMGIDSIKDVLPFVSSAELKRYLIECRDAHSELSREIGEALERFHDKGKSPGPVAKGMSVLKTNLKLGLKETDATVADLMTDGCNMGVKSLSRYLNQYAAAEERAKDMCKRLIKLEEELAIQMRAFL